MSAIAEPLRAPYPYFGGKRRVASVVWERFGNPNNYVEPFFGSGAILLARPHEPKTETANDAHAFIPNFWRALAADPEGVAEWADYPVSECDLHARHLWLIGEGARHVEQCKTDPDYYDVKVAGWWVWGACQWIGSGWCDTGSAHVRQLPHVGGTGRGLTSQTSREIGIYEALIPLRERVKHVRFCCGDWSRVVGPAVTHGIGLTGIFLDPPYSLDDRATVYAQESATVATDVRKWCEENGNNPLLRIALCGYAGEGHEALEALGWDVYAWKAPGGYGSQGEGQGRENAGRERIWFSPNCIKPGSRHVTASFAFGEDHPTHA